VKKVTTSQSKPGTHSLYSSTALTTLGAHSLYSSTALTTLGAHSLYSSTALTTLGAHSLYSSTALTTLGLPTHGVKCDGDLAGWRIQCVELSRIHVRSVRLVEANACRGKGCVETNRSSRTQS
jgi:hypothetical protein